MTETVLPDVLKPGLRVVFCGTAAGRKSAAVGAYYAGVGNRFWPTLYQIGLTPHQLAPSQFRDALQYGIGLTDLAQYASGMDKDLKRTDFAPERFRQKIMDIAPGTVAFTSKFSASVYFGVKTKALRYGLQDTMIGSSKIFVLPSPSGAARSFWDESVWRALTEAVL